VPVTHGVAGSNPVSTARKPSSYKASEKSGAFFCGKNSQFPRF
jgi:hypothetical protein